MKIEQIKNFNQIMLAIIGILGIILLVVLLIMTIVESGIFNRRNYRDTPSGLISDEKVENNLRKQVVSYQLPWLVDTLNAIYIIPVSVTTLDKPEVLREDDGLMSLLDAFPSKEGYYKKQYFGGYCANLIVYYSKNNKVTPLFQERIMLSDVQAYYFKDDILLVFYSSEKDTNKDGIIDMEDDKNLCIYSIKAGNIRKITDGVNFIENYQFLENSKDLLLFFSLNQYKDIKFNSAYKPRKIMKYEFENQQLKEIIPTEIQQEMQNLIDGKK